MNQPDGPDPFESMPTRRTIAYENTLILVCLALLWLPIIGYSGPVVTAVLLADLAAMVWLLGRRKRRVDAVFAEIRRRQEEAERSGRPLGLPGVPGLPPDRLAGREQPEPLSQSNGRPRR